MHTFTQKYYITNIQRHNTHYSLPIGIRIIFWAYILKFLLDIILRRPSNSA